MNIIGEHTDYAGGLALPFTINSRLELEANFSATEYIGDDTIIELWKEAGGPVAELKLQSDIPIGKGLSSSAALCIASFLDSSRLPNWKFTLAAAFLMIP